MRIKFYTIPNRFLKKNSPVWKFKSVKSKGCIDTFGFFPKGIIGLIFDLKREEEL